MDTSVRKDTGHSQKPKKKKKHNTRRAPGQREEKSCAQRISGEGSFYVKVGSPKSATSGERGERSSKKKKLLCKKREIENYSRGLGERKGRGVGSRNSHKRTGAKACITTEVDQGFGLSRF